MEIECNYIARSSNNHEDIINAIKNGAIVWDLIAVNAANHGYVDILKMALEKGSRNWNVITKGAIIGGDLDLLKLAIKGGYDNLKWCLCMAIKHNIFEVARYLISELGLTDYSAVAEGSIRYDRIEIFNLARENVINNWDWLATLAAIKNNTTIFNLLDHSKINSWDNIARYAVTNNNSEIFNMAIKHDISNWEWIAEEAIINSEIFNMAIGHNIKDWNGIAVVAAANNNIDALRLAMEHDIKRWDLIAVSAVKSGNLNIIELAESRGKINYNSIAYEAITRNRLSILEYCLKIVDLKYVNMLLLAIENDRVDCVKLILPKILCDLNWENIISRAVEYRSIDVLRFFNNKINWNKVVSETNDTKILKLAIENGANNWDEIAILSIELGESEITQLTLDKGVNEIDKIAAFAANVGDLKTVRYLSDKIKDWDTIAEASVSKAHLNITLLAINNGAENIDKLVKISNDRWFYHCAAVLDKLRTK
jgi:hypothetical protein